MPKNHIFKIIFKPFSFSWFIIIYSYWVEKNHFSSFTAHLRHYCDMSNLVSFVIRKYQIFSMKVNCMMLYIIRLEFSQRFQINAQFLFLFELKIIMISTMFQYCDLKSWKWKYYDLRSWYGSGWKFQAITSFFVELHW